MKTQKNTTSPSIRNQLHEVLRYNKFNLSDTEAVDTILALFKTIAEEAKPQGLETVASTDAKISKMYDYGYNQGIKDYYSNLKQRIQG